MKAVILAAGEGIRMRPLTLSTPKPLLEVCGKPILGHIFDSLPQRIDEVVLVVGFLGEKIQKFFGDEYNGRKIRYVWQKEKLGTAHALKLCEPFLNEEKFLMLFADDFYSKEDLEKLVKYDLALAVAEVFDPRRFGVVEIDSEKRIFRIEEKPANPRSNLVSTGAMVLDCRIFNYDAVRHSSGEYFLTSMIDGLIKDHCVYAETVSFWFSTAIPEDIKKAEEFLCQKN